MWQDEITTIRVVQQDWPSLVVERANVGHPPAFFMIQKLFLGKENHPDFLYRLIPMFFGACTIVVIYFLIEQQVTPLVALLICLLATLSCSQLLISQMARAYTLIEFLACSVLYLIVNERQSLPVRHALVFLCICASALTHSSVLLTLPTLVLAVLTILPRRWPFTITAMGAMLPYLLFAFVFPKQAEFQEHMVKSASPTLWDIANFPSTLILGRHSQAVATPMLAAISAFCVASIAGALMSNKVVSIVALWIVLLWGASCIACGYGFNCIGIARYFSPAFPAICICIGYSTHRLLCWDRARLVMLVGCVASPALYYSTAPFPDYRGIATKIMQHYEPGELVVVASERAHYAAAAEHYLRLPTLKLIGEADRLPSFRDSGGWFVCDAVNHQRIQEFKAQFGHGEFAWRVVTKNGRKVVYRAEKPSS